METTTPELRTEIRLRLEPLVCEVRHALSRSRDLAVGRAIIAFLGRIRYRLTGAELSETLGMSRAGITLAAQRGERLLNGPCRPPAHPRPTTELINNVPNRPPNKNARQLLSQRAPLGTGCRIEGIECRPHPLPLYTLSSFLILLHSPSPAKPEARSSRADGSGT